jgi:hypothetical protein
MEFEMTVIRRAIYFAILVAGLALAPAVGLTAQPCPPPQFSVSGGTSVTTTCPSAQGGLYTTTFPATENPLNEGGKWINGEANGLNWSNVQTGSGNAYASRLVDTPLACRYCDPIAHVSKSFITFNANQYAQGTVHRVPGYSNLPCCHEVELLLRFDITAGNARGYEILWSQDGWMFIVRWNGPQSDYSELQSSGGPVKVAVDGDVLRAEIGGDNVVRVYVNGSLVMTGPADATFTTGQPGMGFWPTPGASISSYGWKDFTAGNL